VLLHRRDPATAPGDCDRAGSRGPSIMSCRLAAARLD
jgi:hypothetical protein